MSAETASLLQDLQPLLDFAGVLLAAYLGTLLYASFVPGAMLAGVLHDGGRAALAAAVLAPFILCARASVAGAGRRETAALVRCYATRFVMFASVVVAIGLASRSLGDLPRPWLALWLAATLATTALSRLLLAGALRLLERNGLLTETIAVIGAGPRAERMVADLQRARGNRVRILGLFDDAAPAGATPLAGSIGDLLELGQTQPLDWILLALPPGDSARVPGIVHRLKALAVPVGLCPLAHTAASTDTADAAIMPRWIGTVLGLPLRALRAGSPREPLDCRIDNHDLDSFSTIAAAFGQRHFGYVVTPNADHLIRLHRDAAFRAQYADARYVLLDSRFLSRLLRLTRGIALPVCTGSDLTARLLATVARPDDGLVIIGGSAASAARLAQRYGLRRLAHHNPPMGFAQDPAALEACLQFVEAHSPFRFCLLGVGAPQQELLAQRLKQRGIARGLALCVGASLDYLTGRERRAPAWMQHAGLEWLHRLLRSPRRMAWRYLVRGPQLFALLLHTRFELRTAAAPRPRRVERRAVAPPTARRTARAVPRAPATGDHPSS